MLFLTTNPPAVNAAMNVSSLYPVKTENVLLAHPKRQLLIEKIKKNTGLEDSHFERLYLNLIHRYAEFVQVLPMQKGGKLGSLLDYGLVRSSLALHLYTQPPSRKIKAAYAYAIFTLALMRDIGKVVSLQRVIISDKEGQFKRVWSPFEGSLVDQKADYYRIRAADDRWILLGKAVTPMLARQLLPEIGFSLIADDYDLLQRWLNILLEMGTTESDPLIKILQLTDDQLDDELAKLQLPKFLVEQLQPEETALGEEFLAWLIQSLEEGKITMNQPDSGIHIFETIGLVLDIRLFQWFCQRYAAHRLDWLTVFRQFNRLGLTKTVSSEENKPEQFNVSPPEAAAKTRVSYFSSGAQKAQNVAGQNGFPKVLQGVIVTRPDLLNVNIKQLPVSGLKIQPTNIEKEISEASMKEQIAEYMETKSTEKKIYRKNVD